MKRKRRYWRKKRLRNANFDKTDRKKEEKERKSRKSMKVFLT